MTDLFILDDDNNPVPMAEEDLLEWGQWIDAARAAGRHIVGDTKLGAFRVITVFHGCDSNWDEGAPLLFETRVTENGERRDLYLRRYATWPDAQRGHQAMCLHVEQGRSPYEV